MDLKLLDFRRPINFLNHVSRDNEKMFMEKGNFPKEFDKLCLKKDIRVLHVNFDLYHRDERHFPIVINNSLSLHNSFNNFLKDPYKYTKHNSYKKWLFTYNDPEDGNQTKLNYNNKTLRVDQVDSFSKVIDYDMTQWTDWKEKYETFFKLVWLIDEYLQNEQFDFPMGLRTIRNRHQFLTEKNQFVPHPGGTRQTVAKLFGGSQPFITDDGRKKHLLKNFVTHETSIKSLNDLLKISKNKNKRESKVDKLNSTIIFYPATREYEFNFNAVNYINFKIGDYVKDWFHRIESIGTIEIKNPTKQQKFFIEELIEVDWNLGDDSPGTKIWKSIKVVTQFSGTADIELTLSPKIITQVILLPYLIGSSFKEVKTISGFYYHYKGINDKIDKTSLNLKELYTDCFYTDSLISRRLEEFNEIGLNKPLI